MTASPFHFGRPQRPLFGMMHRADGAGSGGMLMCAPLLQDAIRTHRASWMLAEALAAAGIDTLRFDWYGSGDSAGSGSDLELAGLLDDLQSARSALHAASRPFATRLLATRSGALPLLAHAAALNAPVDLVLWEPALVGGDMVAQWQREHRQQLHNAGRYLHAVPDAGTDELLGFEIGPTLLQSLSTLDARELHLAAGSRVLVATWNVTPEIEEFIAIQQSGGVSVSRLPLDPADEPEWSAVHKFENLVLPRRSVRQLSTQLIAQAA